MVPDNFTGDVFLDGFAYTVPAGGFPGGLNPVTINGEFAENIVAPISLNWQWSAAVYSSFGPTPNDPNSFDVKPVRQ